MAGVQTSTSSSGPAPAASRKNASAHSGTRQESFESKGKRGGPNNNNNVNTAATSRAAIYSNPLPLYISQLDTTLALLYSLTWSLSLSCQAIAASLKAKEHSRNRLNQKTAYIPQDEKMQGYWDEHTKSVWVLPTRRLKTDGKRSSKSSHKQIKTKRREAVILPVAEESASNNGAQSEVSTSDSNRNLSATDSQYKDDEEPAPWMDYLWKKGFFGKGSLSRSEPTWWQREKNRVTGEHVPTAEDITSARRAERKVAKLQKAQERADEREKQAVALSESKKKSEQQDESNLGSGGAPKLESKDEEVMPVAQASGEPISSEDGTSQQGTAKQEPIEVKPSITAEQNNDSKLQEQQQQQRSQSTERSIQKPKLPNLVKAAEAQEIKMSEMQIQVPNLEHTQLQREEAFFLVLCTGSLAVVLQSNRGHSEDTEDAETSSQPLDLIELWKLFARSSLSALARNEPNLRLRPDNPFILSYVVYHHYRSLGWVVRNGIKFCVDWVLYKGADGTQNMRGGAGPVGGHAEFAVAVIPTYKDTADAPSNAALKNRRDWRWLNTVNRVCSGVKKTVILTYVTIPRLSDQTFDGHGNLLDWNNPACLKHYKIKEVSIKRFIPTRMRD